MTTYNKTIDKKYNLVASVTFSKNKGFTAYILEGKNKILFQSDCLHLEGLLYDLKKSGLEAYKDFFIGILVEYVFLEECKKAGI